MLLFGLHQIDNSNTPEQTARLVLAANLSLADVIFSPATRVNQTTWVEEWGKMAFCAFVLCKFLSSPLNLDLFWNDRYNIDYFLKERHKESLAPKLLTVKRLLVRLCGFFGARVTQQHLLKTWRKPCTWAGAVSMIRLVTSGHYFWKHSSITVSVWSAT